MAFDSGLDVNVWTAGLYSINGFAMTTLTADEMPNPDPGRGADGCGWRPRLVLGPRRVTVDETFEACESITTHGELVVTGTASVEFRAGEVIAFGDGFAATGDMSAATVSWFGWP